jgi:hypothetical protein
MGLKNQRNRGEKYNSKTRKIPKKRKIKNKQLALGLK